MILLVSCGHSIQNNNDYIKTNPKNLKLQSDSVVGNKTLLFKQLSEIDTSYSVWVDKQDSDIYSLSLHFMYKDTLAISYSNECWLMFPYKIENNKFIVYWDNYIDSKYEFDIVKAFNKIDTSYIGQNFMTLELINDTTLYATYPIEEIRRKINGCNKKRKFFPDKFVVVQKGGFSD